jgi:hypothetical protein
MRAIVRELAPGCEGSPVVDVAEKLKLHRLKPVVSAHPRAVV